MPTVNAKGFICPSREGAARSRLSYNDYSRANSGNSPECGGSTTITWSWSRSARPPYGAGAQCKSSLPACSSTTSPGGFLSCSSRETGKWVRSTTRHRCRRHRDGAAPLDRRLYKSTLRYSPYDGTRTNVGLAPYAKANREQRSVLIRVPMGAKRVVS